LFNNDLFADAGRSLTQMHLIQRENAIVASTKTFVNPLPPSNTVRKQKKIILEDLFSSVLSQLKKYHSSGNLKFNSL